MNPIGSGRTASVRAEGPCGVTRNNPPHDGCPDRHLVFRDPFGSVPVQGRDWPAGPILLTASWNGNMDLTEAADRVRLKPALRRAATDAKSARASLQDLGDLVEVIAPVDQFSVRPDQDVRRNEADRVPREDVVRWRRPGRRGRPGSTATCGASRKLLASA